MAIFAKQAYARRARRHGAARRALRAGRGRLLGDRRRARRGTRRGRRPPARAAPRRVVLAALALGAVGYSVQAACFFSRAAPHRRVADVAAALHVPRARLLRRGRARPRARHAVRRRWRSRSPAPAPRSCCSAAAAAGWRRPACCSALGAARGLRASTSSSPTASSARDRRVALMGALVATGAAATFARRRRARPARSSFAARRLDLDRRDRAALDRAAGRARSCSACSASAPRRRRSSRRSSRS